MNADLILYNGNFITLDEKNPCASAMVVIDGKISKIGNYEDVKDLIGGGTDKLNLEGKTVVPGFIDAHIHLISLGLAMQVMDLQEITSKTVFLDKIKEKVEDTPPKHWVRGFGFDEAELDELPTRLELDPISPRNPVYLEDINSKICIVNSLALKKVYNKKDLEDVKIERNRYTGKITGVIRVKDKNFLYEVARIPTLDPVDKTLEESELEIAIEKACQKVIEVGITSIHDIQMPPNGLRAYKKAVCDDKIPLRLYLGCDRNKNIEIQDYIDEGLGTEPIPNRVRIGLVKLFADGRMPIPEFNRRAREAHEAGYQLTIHSSDSRQVENSIEAIEEALKLNPRKNHRHKIEHAHTLTKELIERIAHSRAIISTQPELISKFDRRFPEDVMVVPIRSMLGKGIRVAGGSDSPILSARRRAAFPRSFPNPLIGVGFEVSRKTEKGLLVQEDERISILEALKIHSFNGAYASFEEDIKGTLEVGKLADLVVLSENPFEVDPERIKDIEVEKTIIGGKVVYTKNQ